MFICLSATRWSPAVLISGSLPFIVLSFLVCFCACLFVCLAPQGGVGGVAESMRSVYYLVAPHKKPVFVFSLIDCFYVCLLVCLFVCLSATGWSRTVRGGGWERAYYSVAPYKEPVFVPHIHRWQGLGHCGGEHQLALSLSLAMRQRIAMKRLQTVEQIMYLREFWSWRLLFCKDIHLFQVKITRIVTLDFEYKKKFWWMEKKTQWIS